MWQIIFLKEVWNKFNSLLGCYISVRASGGVLYLKLVTAWVLYMILHFMDVTTIIKNSKIIDVMQNIYCLIQMIKTWHVINTTNWMKCTIYKTIMDDKTETTLEVQTNNKSCLHFVNQQVYLENAIEKRSCVLHFVKRWRGCYLKKKIPSSCLCLCFHFMYCHS